MECAQEAGKVIPHKGHKSVIDKAAVQKNFGGVHGKRARSTSLIGD